MFFYPLYAYTVAGYADYGGSRTGAAAAGDRAGIPLGEMLLHIMDTPRTRQNRSGSTRILPLVLVHPIVTKPWRACTQAVGYGTDLAFSVRGCGFP